jgi:hypothetical protein
MTKRKVPSILDSAIDVDHQSSLILAAFSQYLEENSTRSIVLSRPDRGRRGWLVETVERRSARGNSLRDATAQIATALRLESETA